MMPKGRAPGKGRLLALVARGANGRRWWKADIAVVVGLAQTSDMLRRAIFPFVTCTALIAAALLAWATFAAPANSILRWHDIRLAILWISPFTSIGLLPIFLVAWIADRITSDRTLRRLALLSAGGAIGTLFLLPLTEMLSFDLFIGTAAGVFSAGVWMVFNPERAANAPDETL